MATEIYIDVLFLLNLMIDFFLLRGCAGLVRVAAKAFRLALAAVIGAVYAVAIFFPGFSYLDAPVFRVMFAAVMIIAAFGFHTWRQFLKLTACLYGLSFLLGGTLWGLYYFTGFGAGGRLLIRGGAVYFSFPVWLLLFYTAVLYGVMMLTAKMLSRRKEVDEKLYTVTLFWGGREVSFPAMADSGNLLRSLSGDKSVMVVDREKLAPLFDGALPDILAEDGGRENPPGLRGRLFAIPYHSLGNAGGILTAFMPEGAVIAGGGKAVTQNDILVGISPAPLSADGQFYGLLSSESIQKMWEAV